MPVAIVDRISSVDKNYAPGDLSLYPHALDNQNQLYVANNAQTVTTQSISYNATYFIVQDTSSFPSTGLIMVGTEQVYYTVTTPNSFNGLQRGFAGSRQDQWPIGTVVHGAVLAELHNGLKDAVINIETNLGTTTPTATSLNGLLKSLETRFLAPRPMFRAAPRFGLSPLTVTFQNFTESPTIGYLWNFGDGSTSQDFAPTHVYQSDGNYDVSLNVITSLNAQGTATKTNYIQVGVQYGTAFFYVIPTSGTTSTVFTFVDQTDGTIVSRYWVWGDGNNLSVLDPNVHTATHQYSIPGTYSPSLLVVFSDGTSTTVQSEESIIIT